MSRFKSKKELRLVIDEMILAIDADADVGPRLRALGTPVEIWFRDFDLTINVRAGEEGESNLVAVWSKRVRWKPETRIEVTTDVANQFLQGRLQVARALALRKVKVKGSLTAGLKIVAVAYPMLAQYRTRIEEDFPHLVL